MISTVVWSKTDRITLKVKMRKHNIDVVISWGFKMTISSENFSCFKIGGRQNKVAKITVKSWKIKYFFLEIVSNNSYRFLQEQMVI